MVKYKRPKLVKVGKVGHAKTAKHQALDLVAVRSKLKALTAERKGSGGTAKLRTHAGKGLRAQFGLPANKRGSSH